MPAFLGLGPDNPVAWCNFHRKGGFRSMLATSGGYLAILVALIVVSGGVSRGDFSNTASGWAQALLGLQVLFMVLIGAGRVSNTIRGDLSSGMIESLRMMPLAEGHAIAGYVTSGAVTLGGFFGVNFVLGMIMTGMAELPVDRWVAANAILFSFALFAWTLAAFMAFQVKSAGAVLMIVGLVGSFGNAGVLYAAPGLVLLVGPLIGGTIFNLRSSQTEVSAPLLLSVAAQVMVGAIFVTGAARKFRRPNALALGAWLGLALLLSIIGVSLLALLRPESFAPEYLLREFRHADFAVPFCGSVILAMAVALIPLANFARLHVEWVRGRATDDPRRRRTVPPPIVAGPIVTAALTLMTLALPHPPGAMRLGCFVASMLGFSMSTIFLAAWVYRIVDNAKVILAIWLIAYCLLPLGVDAARNQQTSRADRYRYVREPMLRMPASFSPIGMTIELVTQPGANLRPGAIAHVVLPALPIALYLRAGRRKRVVAPVATPSV